MQHTITGHFHMPLSANITARLNANDANDWYPLILYFENFLVLFSRHTYVILLLDIPGIVVNENRM